MLSVTASDFAPWLLFNAPRKIRAIKVTDTSSENLLKPGIDLNVKIVLSHQILHRTVQIITCTCNSADFSLLDTNVLPTFVYNHP